MYIISHPGTGKKILCESFKEAQKWFEGFNLPRKIYVEPSFISHKRMDDFMNKRLEDSEKGQGE